MIRFLYCAMPWCAGPGPEGWHASGQGMCEMPPDHELCGVPNPRTGYKCVRRRGFHETPGPHASAVMVFGKVAGWEYWNDPKTITVQHQHGRRSAEKGQTIARGVRDAIRASVVPPSHLGTSEFSQWMEGYNEGLARRGSDLPVSRVVLDVRARTACEAILADMAKICDDVIDEQDGNG